MGGLAWVGLNGATLQAASDAFTFGVRTDPGVRMEPGALVMDKGHK